MTQDTDVFAGMQDHFRTKMGGEATYCFLFTAPIVIIVQDGWRALISWKALGFIIVGMFVSAIILGNVAYWTYFSLFSRMKRRYENGQIKETDVVKSMRPLGCMVSAGLLVVSATLSWFVWGWLTK